MMISLLESLCWRWFRIPVAVTSLLILPVTAQATDLTYVDSSHGDGADAALTGTTRVAVVPLANSAGLNPEEMKVLNDLIEHQVRKSLPKERFILLTQARTKGTVLPGVVRADCSGNCVGQTKSSPAAHYLVTGRIARLGDVLRMSLRVQLTLTGTSLDQRSSDAISAKDFHAGLKDSISSLVVTLSEHADGARASSGTEGDTAVLGSGVATNDVPSDEVVVTGTRTEQRRADSPVATEVITREQLEESGASTLSQVMAMTAGLQVDRSFAGVGVALQGMDPKHTLILIDGERLNGAKEGIFDLERLNVERVQRVEILRGAGSALYGADAIGGVINIITRELPTEGPLKAVGGSTVMIGSDMSAEASGRLGGRSQSLSGQLVGGYHHLPAFNVIDGDVDQTTHGSEINDWYLKGSTRWRWSPRSRLTGSVEYARRQRTGIDSAATGAIYDRRQLVDTYEGRVHAEHKTDAGDRLVGSVRANHTRDQFMSDQRNSSTRDRYEDTRLWLTQANAQYDVKLPYQNVLSIGMDGILETADNPRIVRFEDCNYENPSAQCRIADRRRGAIYAQDVLTALLDPYLVFVAGVRLEGDSLFGIEAVPRVAIRYDPHTTLILRASVGNGYRAPTFKELYLRFDNPSVGYTVRGNDQLTPEHALSYQLSLNWTISSPLSLHLNLFRNDIDDRIDFALVESGSAGNLDRYQLKNISKAYTQGIESELSFRIWPVIELRAGYRFLDAQDVSANRPLSGRARNQINGTMNLQHPSSGISMSTIILWTGERPFYLENEGDDARRETADAYVNLVVTVGWKLNRVLSLTMRGENLLDEGDPTFLAQRPRRYVLSLKSQL